MLNNPQEVQDHTHVVIVKEPDQDENNQSQSIGKGRLVKLQEEDADQVHIWEKIVSEPEAALTQVRYYSKSGVLMRRWRRPLDAQGNEI